MHNSKKEGYIRDATAVISGTYTGRPRIKISASMLSSFSMVNSSLWATFAVSSGTPAILVPYPHATADHQTLNARHFEQGGGAVVVPDGALDRVPALVDELLASPDRLAAMRTAMLGLARPQAADEIAEELIRLAGR